MITNVFFFSLPKVGVMDPPVVETKQGKVSGKFISVSSELTEKRCANFNAIPFAKYERLERAEPFGKWEGTLDGTGTHSLYVR